jgi:thiol-disulfide isomerase/thioredoxin
MRFTFAVVVFALGIGEPVRALGAVWRNEIGQQTEGELAGIYGPYALISSKTHSTLITLADMDSPSLDQVAAVLNAKTDNASLWKNSGTDVGRLVKNLQILDGEKLVAFDPAERPEPELYLVYFSAHWCGPCRRFTPHLRETYEHLKTNPALAGRFELIFVSSDENSRAQLEYAREADMPWPMLKYNAVGSTRVLDRHKGDGIPCLVVVNRQGIPLFHSYRGGEYLGPSDPLEKFATLLGELDERHPGTKAARHRLAVRQRLIASAGKDLSPQAYLVSLDKKRFAGCPVKEFTIELVIAPDGRVMDFRAQPSLPAVAESLLQTEASNWLFLPALEAGKPVTKTISVPISL